MRITEFEIYWFSVVRMKSESLIGTIGGWKKWVSNRDLKIPLRSMSNSGNCERELFQPF